jgi:hypothetical protein
MPTLLMHQLRVKAIIAAELAAVFIVLLIVFGPPTQMTTMIGLATSVVPGNCGLDARCGAGLSLPLEFLHFGRA